MCAFALDGLKNVSDEPMNKAFLGVGCQTNYFTIRGSSKHVLGEERKSHSTSHISSMDFKIIRPQTTDDKNKIIRKYIHRLYENKTIL